MSGPRTSGGRRYANRDRPDVPEYVEYHIGADVNEPVSISVGRSSDTREQWTLSLCVLLGSMEWVLWWIVPGAVVVLLAARRALEGRDSQDATDRDRDATDRPSTERTAEPPPVVPSAPVHEGSTRTEPLLEPGECPTCGTVNDPFYSYCRECVTPLRGAQ